MRSGFLALCGFVVLRSLGFAQTPVILEQPVGQVAYLTDSASLTVVVESATPPSFQWHRNGQALHGATQATLTVSPITLDDHGLYHVVVTNTAGSTTSFPALIFVTKRPQTIAFNPATTTVVAGSGVVLTATSSVGLPVSFTLLSGAASLAGNVLTGAGGNVAVRATQAGNETVAAAESVTRTFQFVSGMLTPFITSPPLDLTVDAGNAATLRATAIGTPAPTYQWQKDATPIAGATNATLTLTSSSLADSGRYTIVASNSAGAATASATLTVRAAPAITRPPAAQAVFAGENATFAVTAIGFPSPTFQWRRNGAALTGATQSNLTLSSVEAANAGSYDVVATNVLGSVTSPAAALTVTTRDYSGVYFGQLAGAAGEFALVVRADRSAVFLAHSPAQQTGLAVTSLQVDWFGSFSRGTTTLAAATAAAAQPVTLSGTINDQTGAINGTLTGLGLTFEGARRSSSGTAAGVTGYYPIAAIGQAATLGHVVVAADGTAWLLLIADDRLDAARGTVDAAGRLTAATATQDTIDATIAHAALRGTWRTANGGTSTVFGVAGDLVGPERLANLSVRAVSAPGNAPLIAGFVVAGPASKQVLIRVAGPTLGTAPFNLADIATNPSLQVFRGNASIGENDNWGTPAANATSVVAAANRVGAFPFRAGSADAALVTTLNPGAYSVVVGGSTGTALAEIYEVLQNNEAPGTRRLVNLSARGRVTPAASLIAGFVITGPGPQRVLIRGVGPTLGAAPFNLPGTLPNPQLTLFRGATAVKSNDDWFREPTAARIRDATTRAGAFALGTSSLDAALLVYLEPGAYTAQVTTSANASGTAMIEIYEAAP